MDPQQLLMDTFKFSVHDLECNQSREQSEAQRIALRRETWQLWLIANGLWIFPLIMLVMANAGWGAIVGISALWVGGITLTMLLHLRDMSVIHAVTDNIQLEIKPKDAYVSPQYEDMVSPYFRLIMDKERLYLSPVAHRTLEKTLVGASCTIFYRKSGRRRDILSIALHEV